MAGRIDDLRDEVDVLEYRAGDIRALERLISRWQPRMYTYILGMLGERDAAWDVSQDLWEATISALARGAAVERFPAWIYGVARNKCVSYLRKKRACLDMDEAPEEADTRAETSDTAALRAEEARIVRESLTDLSLPLREAMILFHLEGLSLDQTALILGVPRGTVQSRLHAGRRALGKMLARKGLGNDGR